MTPTGQPEHPQKEEAAETTTRRPYKTPRLRHLGSVRELTLGGTMGVFDGVIGMKQLM